MTSVPLTAVDSARILLDLMQAIIAIQDNRTEDAIQTLEELSTFIDDNFTKRLQAAQEEQRNANTSRVGVRNRDEGNTNVLHPHEMGSSCR